MLFRSSQSASSSHGDDPRLDDAELGPREGSFVGGGGAWSVERNCREVGELPDLLAERDVGRRGHVDDIVDGGCVRDGRAELTQSVHDLGPGTEHADFGRPCAVLAGSSSTRSEEHTSELQSH